MSRDGGDAIKWLRSQPRLSQLLDESPELLALFSGETSLDLPAAGPGEDADLDGVLAVAPTIIRVMPQLRRLSDELGRLSDELDDPEAEAKLEELRSKLGAIPPQSEVDGLEKMLGAMAQMQKLGGLAGMEKMAQDMSRLAGQMQGSAGPGAGAGGDAAEQLKRLEELTAGLGSL